MPIITFCLFNRRFIHEVRSKYSNRILVFDAVPEGWTEIAVKGVGNIEKGVVRIHEGELSEEIGRIIYVPSYKECESDKVNPHVFQIEATISPSTFHTLLTYDENTLHFQFTFTSIHNGNLDYGFAPDGSMIDWDVEKQQFELAESIQIFICSKEKDD
jgi:hypothetical protein